MGPQVAQELTRNPVVVGPPAPKHSVGSWGTPTSALKAGAARVPDSAKRASGGPLAAATRPQNLSAVTRNYRNVYTHATLSKLKVEFRDLGQGPAGQKSGQLCPDTTKRWRQPARHRQHRRQHQFRSKRAAWWLRAKQREKRPYISSTTASKSARPQQTIVHAVGLAAPRLNTMLYLRSSSNLYLCSSRSNRDAARPGHPTVAASWRVPLGTHEVPTMWVERLRPFLVPGLY